MWCQQRLRFYKYIYILIMHATWNKKTTIISISYQWLFLTSLSHISIKFPFLNTHPSIKVSTPLEGKNPQTPNHVLNWVVSIFATLHSHPLFSNTCHPKPTKIPAHFQAFTAQFLQHDGCNNFYNQLWIQELDRDFHCGCAESRE